ncbi:MAG: response regulator transcription factor [Tannerellaceae bacterium]|jgi:DNA-binding NarL/FixJ family response regulator|nr:response regulator transcription factor [Tannerellaceae bacterium]
MIQVHITDDHKLVAGGISLLIENSDVATVSGISYSLAECRKALAFGAPDVLLLDLKLPDGDGISFCAEILNHYPELKVLILTSHEEYSFTRRAMANGAAGYMLKADLAEELITGLETVMKGRRFVSFEIETRMKKTEEHSVRLTLRERQVLEGVADGYTNQEIADRLGLSIQTVKSYHKSLNQKINANNPTELVRKAIDMGEIKRTVYP